MQDRPRGLHGGMPPPLPRALARARGDPAVGMRADRARGPTPSPGSRRPGAAAPPAGCAPELIRDASARAWEEVFDERATVSAAGGSFCCYAAGLCGRAGGVVCVLLHGGGHCALSWGLVAQRLKRTCGVLAFDARGHGESRADDEGDLSAAALVADAAAVVRGFFAGRGGAVPPLVVVGHSMGGAVGVRLAASGLLGACVRGLVVVDVVEGTAMAALPHMRAWLGRRKCGFDSVESGVRYVVEAGHVRNVASARLSVPRQLTYRADRGKWVWRTDLEKSSAHWNGWFHGLSQLFLSVPAAKMLVLAGVDRLDKELMIAQMQGKFQNMVIPGAGHVVQEDRPSQTADVLREYLVRNCFVDDDGERSGSSVSPCERLSPCC